MAQTKKKTIVSSTQAAAKKQAKRNEEKALKAVDTPKKSIKKAPKKFFQKNFKLYAIKVNAEALL